MMKNIKLLFLFVSALLAANTAFAQSRIGGRVVEIVDGRTVVIETYANGKLTAQLQYIEVPEAEQPFHKIAKEHLGVLVLNQKVELRARGFTPTRTVGQLFAGGVDIGQQMIRDGAAWYALPEKSGQDANESKIYESNEAQAKTEKRGIWSIENLKPSWQIRAEAEENRRQQERVAREKEAETAKTAAESTPKIAKPKVRPQLTSESQMWAGTAEAFGKLPENVSNVGGLMVGYNPSVKLGFAATPLLEVEVAEKDGSQAIGVGVAYVYFDGNESKGRQSLYMIGVVSESRDFKFLKFNDLVVTADNQKIVVGKAVRKVRKNDYSVRETLAYRVKRSVLAKIADAEKVNVKVGTYSTTLNSEIQTMLKNLLNVSQ